MFGGGANLESIKPEPLKFVTRKPLTKKQRKSLRDRQVEESKQRTLMALGLTLPPSKEAINGD